MLIVFSPPFWDVNNVQYLDQLPARASMPGELYDQLSAEFGSAREFVGLLQTEA
jgi:hypothetical protein